MVQLVIFVVNLFASVTGMVAAVYWFRSATMKYPSDFVAIVPVGGVGRVNTKPLLEAMQESARLNKLAAIYTCAAAFLLALSSAFTVLSGPH